MNFKQLIGQKVFAVIPMFHELSMEEICILSVECGGVWVESARLAQLWERKCGIPVQAKKLAWFLPFSELRVVVAATDAKPAASET